MSRKLFKYQKRVAFLSLNKPSLAEHTDSSRVSRQQFDLTSWLTHKMNVDTADKLRSLLLAWILPLIFIVQEGGSNGIVYVLKEFNVSKM